MKKITLSLATIVATSTFALAGGDIAPVEPMIQTPVVMEEAAPSVGGFYLGLAYGYEDVSICRTSTNKTVFDEKFGSIMFDAGYKFNQYIALEGRYWAGINSSNALSWRTGINSDVTVDALGLYVKPMFPVSDAFNIYGLVGYGSVDAKYEPSNNLSITSDTVSGFSWGLGAEYAVTSNWSVFVDYTSILDGEEGNLDAFATEDSLSTVNVGVNYQF